MLEEDVELLVAIVSNDDNLSHGNIISVYTSPDEAITALTDHGLEELTDMLCDARRMTKTWHEFLDDFVDAPSSSPASKAGRGNNRTVTTGQTGGRQNPTGHSASSAMT